MNKIIHMCPQCGDATYIHDALDSNGNRKRFRLCVLQSCGWQKYLGKSPFVGKWYTKWAFSDILNEQLIDPKSIGK